MEWKEISKQEARVPGERLEAFEKRLFAEGVNIHGFVMLDGGKLLAERYFGSYGRESLHRMFSAGKSFTSLAVGLLCQEGRLSLEDRICDYFRDKCPKKLHPWIEGMTIRDMLCMTTAHSKTTYKDYGGDWVESFFHVEPTNLPGAVFSYDTSSTHVLSALVERLSGRKMMDYLREKAFDRIGFSKGAYFIPDPYGVSQGGSGLMCTLRDLLSAAQLVMDGGSFQGEQLLPPDYLKEAVACQVSTAQQTAYDESFGYGYQIWRGRHDSFYFYGIGGQLAVCLPEENFIFASMGNTIGNPNGIKDIFDAFYGEIYPCLNSGKKEQKPAEGEAYSELEREIEGRVYRLGEGTLRFDMLLLRAERDRFVLELGKERRLYRIPFGRRRVLEDRLCFYGAGRDGREERGESARPCSASGSWLGKDYLFLRCELHGEEAANITIGMRFQKDAVTVQIKRFPGDCLPDFDGVASGRQKTSDL